MDAVKAEYIYREGDRQKTLTDSHFLILYLPIRRKNCARPGLFIY